MIVSEQSSNGDSYWQTLNSSLPVWIWPAFFCLEIPLSSTIHCTYTNWNCTALLHHKACKSIPMKTEIGGSTWWLIYQISLLQNWKSVCSTNLKPLISWSNPCPQKFPCQMQTITSHVFCVQTIWMRNTTAWPYMHTWTKDNFPPNPNTNPLFSPSYLGRSSSSLIILILHWRKML
jgi:hypothetical protein